MKKLIIYLVIPFFALTLSNCKKDCNGSFTIEGTLWNGTKNKPRTGLLVKAVAGKGNSIFSTGSNVKDVGNARTDENGKFKITYNCVGDYMDGISLSSPDLKYSGISNENRLPINQNYSQFYNIPDSVTINVTLKGSALAATDTIYFCAPTASLYYDAITYFNPFYIYFNSNTIKTYRLTYTGRPEDTYFVVAIGYQNLITKLKNRDIVKMTLTKLEPETNDIIINY